MKLYELINTIKLLANVFLPKTIGIDKVNFENFDVKSIGISRTATVAVIKKCIEEKKNLLIVCEPIFYNLLDDTIPNEIAVKKKKLIENNNIIILRLSNFNYTESFNEFKHWGLSGEWQKRTNPSVNSFIFEKPLTAIQIARTLEASLKIKHIKIVGCADEPGKRISACFATEQLVLEELFYNGFIVSSESNKQLIVEIINDCADFGINKALILIPHSVSKGAGMTYLCDFIQYQFQNINCKYIECGEMYKYTD